MTEKKVSVLREGSPSHLDSPGGSVDDYRASNYKPKPSKIDP